MNTLEAKGNLFICYSPYLRCHIESIGIEPLIEGLHPKTNGKFKVYWQTPELSVAIKEYKQMSKKLKEDDVIEMGSRSLMLV
ncbi:hypothetical protein F9U64_16290 [Gracilibacillus oryzae]|uniref:Uncharacterized protein n=1 Tax=Gracilibacillus oryzae TaxID=1672701 RepID=A0A7C8KXT5_9BACI|nr:hypothetical protein [Gracilibacillus oryzae]KAB8128490.1 hypothetical protein F9U64_16290 [Gracilibacillus oryzae]